MSGFGTDGSFLGAGWSFPPEFEKGGRLKMVKDEGDIGESLHIILSTIPGERVMQPAFGCGLKSMVFEKITEGVTTQIKDLIERAILFFEPRITLENIVINAEEMDNGLLKIDIQYRVRATNSRYNLVYPFYINEGTNVQL